LYPATGFKKVDVINYYMEVSPVLLPHLKNRPISLKRYPDGVDGFFFYEKQCPSHRPKWVDTARVLSRREAGFIDWSQNDEHKTTVCAYSLRAKDHPTVSTPVTWKEVAEAKKRGDAALLTFDSKDVLSRIKRKGDLFEPVLTLKQKLPKIGSVAKI